MRELASRDRILRLMREIGRAADEDIRGYLTGGACAVLHGWRETTLDANLSFFPERDALFQVIPGLKESLDINIELASPPDFVPPIPGWEDRSPFITREGRMDWHHFDFYSQALAKLERAHPHDLGDVREMRRRGLVETNRLLECFEEIRGGLIRYPAIDPEAMAGKVKAFCRETG